MPGTPDTNPLREVVFRIPFDRIRAEHVRPAIAEWLTIARERLDKLAACNQPSYTNTLEALDVLSEPLDWAMGVVRHLESVATYPELRAAFNAVQPEVSAFYTGIPLNGLLWQHVKAFAGTPEAAQLTGPRLRFLRKTVESFRRHGADLDPAGKQRLEEIDVELTQDHHQVRGERAGFDQRLRAGAHRPGGAGRTAAHRGGQRARKARSARGWKAGDSRCRRPTISR